MTVHIIGQSKRLSMAKSVLEAAELPFKRLLTLPVPTSRDGVCVTGTDVKLEELLTGLDKDTAVAGYALPAEFAAAAKGAAGRVYDAAYDEEFLLKNADLTAIGALGEIIGAKERAPEDVRFGIIGYGRIGKALLKYLYFLGARPTVYTTRESVRRELGACGIRSESAESPMDLLGLDVLINTAPTAITDKRGAEELTEAGVTVFDLASGENFGGSEHVIRLGGVPDRAYPGSAGTAYAEAIITALGKPSC